MQAPSINRFSDWICTVEVLPRKSLVDDGNTGGRVAGAEVPAVDEGNLHRGNPARGDIPKVGQDLGWRGAADRNEVIPGVSVHQRPVGKGDGLDAWQRAQTISHLVPKDRRLRTLRDGIESENPIGGKARGLIRQPVERGDKEAGNEEYEKTEGDLGRDQRLD